jgi:hypothetical protein
VKLERPHLMNPDVKGLWLEALRSGRIPQAKGYLGKPDGSRCCLGVLCDIAVQSGVIPPPEETTDESELDDDGWIACLSYDGGITKDLPDPVSRWAGIEEQYLDGTQMWSSDEDPAVTFTDEWRQKWGYTSIEVSNRASLSMLNDRGVPFEGIAELIEEQL